MIRKLLKSLKGYEKNAILSPLFVAVESAMDIMIPFIMSFLLKEGIEANDVGKIFLYGGILVLMALVALLFGALSGAQCAKASCGFAHNLRRDMYANVQTFSFENVDKFSPSGIVTRMTTDVNFVQNSFQMIIRIAVRCPFMLIFALVMTAVMGGRLAVIYVAIVPVMVFGLYLIFISVHKIFKRLFKKYDVLNRVVEENIRGQRVVKSNVREDFEIAKFEETSEEIYKDFSKAQRILALNNPLMQLAMYATIICLAWFGSQIIVGTAGVALSSAELTTLVTYATQILMSLMMLSTIFANVTISRASAERITELLDEKSTIVSPENAVKQVSDGSITFDGVSFSYTAGGKNALTDINLEIPSGSTIGIIGGTGSSKTTLVQLIPRLYDATEGVVRVGGKDVREYDLEVLRRSVAMVLQKNVLFSGTVRENLAWGNPEATDEEMREALRLASADDFIAAKEGGLDARVEQGGANFSGGQRQRLCIARAIIAKPKIIILDDSTSAVDTGTDLKIRRGFREMIPETTKIIIAQRVASVMDADKIIVLDGGKIESVGTHEQLMKDSVIYSEVYSSQIGGGDFDENAD